MSLPGLGNILVCRKINNKVGRFHAGAKPPIDTVIGYKKFPLRKIRAGIVFEAPLLQYISLFRTAPMGSIKINFRIGFFFHAKPVRRRFQFRFA